MAAVCFLKPEVVITQPWIEIYQTSAVTARATGIRFVTPWLPSIWRNGSNVITVPEWFDLDESW